MLISIDHKAINLNFFKYQVYNIIPYNFLTFCFRNLFYCLFTEEKRFIFTSCSFGKIRNRFALNTLKIDMSTLGLFLLPGHMNKWTLYIIVDNYKSMKSQLKIVTLVEN